MFKYRMLFGLVAVLLMSTYAMGAYVTPAVENYSFEEPDTVQAQGSGNDAYKHNAWDEESNAKGTFTDVPDWESDTGAADSGVEKSTGYGSTDGVYAGFLMNGPDPSVWNIVSYRVQTGDQFKLAVDARNNWSAGSALGPQLQISLFYIDDGSVTGFAGARVTPLTWNKTVNLTDAWETFYLDLGDTTAAVGRLIGVELENVTEDVWGAGSSWIGIDNVRFVPEPTTMLLLGLGSVLSMRRRK